MQPCLSMRKRKIEEAEPSCKIPPKYEEKSKRPALAGHGPVLQGDQGDQQGETHADVHVPAV